MKKFRIIVLIANNIHNKRIYYIKADDIQEAINLVLFDIGKFNKKNVYCIKCSILPVAEEDRINTIKMYTNLTLIDIINLSDDFYNT